MRHWKSAVDYGYIGDLTAFAWEFLRRNPDYQAAYRSITSEHDLTSVAEHWGCAIDPNLRSDQISIDWRQYTTAG
jgi:hypothetical protein